MVHLCLLKTPDLLGIRSEWEPWPFICHHGPPFGGKQSHAACAQYELGKYLGLELALEFLPICVLGAYGILGYLIPT